MPKQSSLAASATSWLRCEHKACVAVAAGEVQRCGSSVCFPYYDRQVAEAVPVSLPIRSRELAAK